MIRRPPRSTLFPYTRSSDLQREGIDGELAHDLTLGACRREWVINDGDDAASAFAGALRHQLLDPVGQPRHRRGGAPHHPVPPPRAPPPGPPPPPPPRGGVAGAAPAPADAARLRAER